VFVGMGPRSSRRAATSGSSSSPSVVASVPVEVDDLRRSHRRQARVIDTLSAAICALRVVASALTAENADLRAQRERRPQTADPLTGGPLPVAESVEVRLRLDVR
jgi:hypothetical protein